MHPEHHAEIEQQKSRYTCGKWNILVFFYLQPLLTGAKDGVVVRALGSRQCGPGSNPGVDAICGLSLLLVLSFAPRGFSPGTPVFPSPQKPNFSNFQFDQESGDEEPVCGCVISKSLFIFLFIHLFIATIPVIAVSNFQNLHHWAFSLFCEMSITFPLLALMNANDTRFYLKTQGVQ